MKAAIGCFLVASLALVTSAPQPNSPHLLVAKSNNRFTSKFYNELSKKAGNVFFSPFGLHSILSMLHQQATGSSSRALSRVLELPEAATTGEGYKRILEQLASSTGSNLTVANRIFVDKRFAVKSGFQTKLEKSFHADIQRVDFHKDGEASDAINKWVREKIKKVAYLTDPSNFDDMTALVLVNVIYLRSSWSKPFRSIITFEENFYPSNGRSVKCEMMHSTDYFLHRHDTNLKAEVLTLEFSENDIKMSVVLPDDPNGIKDLEAKLTNYDISNILKGGSLEYVEVSLPKFRFDVTVRKMKDHLIKMGLREIFNDGADLDFVEFTPGGLGVDEIIHQTFIDVDETGVKTSTDTGETLTNARADFDILRFKANHPFIVLIHSVSNELVLFYGKVEDPTSRT